MAKLKNPFLGFDVKGSLAKAISFRSLRGQHILEKRPLPADPKSPAQLQWRTLYQQAIALWHALSAAEKIVWEAQGTARHMTGYAWFLSQCLRPNPGIYLPLLGGTMQGDVDTDSNKITGLPTPTQDHHAATKKYVDDATPPAPDEIIDADGDTKVQVEESPDEDKVRMDVKGVEAFLLNDLGVLSLAKQSRARAYQTKGQSIPSGSVTKVELDIEDYDNQGEYDHVTNYRFTAKTAGYYFVCGNAVIDAIADGTLYITRIDKNGTAIIALARGNIGNAGAAGVSVSAIPHLAVNEYLELFTYHNHGAPRTLSTTAGYNQISIHKLS